MTNLQKKEIVDTIQSEIKVLGSANKVAIKCKVSSATISQMINQNWELISDDKWLQVASKLGHDFSEWVIVSTTNYKMMKKAISEAKEECYFLPISDKAGAGKTTGIKGFVNDTKTSHNYFLKCRQWAAREFLEHLMRSLGLEVPRGYQSIDSLGQHVIDFFVERKTKKPTLCLDQANSLKASALKFIIHLFNEMEDKMSLIIVGTEALEKEIKRGVRYQKDGYDEIDSRFGRNYLKLFGNTAKDIEAICTSNGIADKKLHKKIFKECKPTPKVVKIQDVSQTIYVVEDTRRIKRIIKRDRKQLAKAATQERKEAVSA